MSTPGYVFRDGGVTPPLHPDDVNTQAHEVLAQQEQHIQPSTAISVHAPLAQGTSASHELAVSNHEILGTVQQAGKEDSLTNLGWQDNHAFTAAPQLIGGIDNEDFFTLLRRFNKVR